jgi:hypothetical protein
METKLEDGYLSRRYSWRWELFVGFTIDRSIVRKRASFVDLDGLIVFELFGLFLFGVASLKGLR